MIKRLFTTTLLLTFFAAVAFGLFTGRITNLVKAAQCWEPGCCGFTLVYNQYSCVQDGSEQYCRALGEEPYWYCTVGGGSYGTGSSGEDACNRAVNQGSCLGECDKRCTGGWASFCQVTSGSVSCVESGGQCYGDIYAIQCQSQAGVNDCSGFTAPLDRRSCWVTGAPQPSTEPPPDPGNCDGNWYHCDPFCARAPDGVGVCGSCPSQCAHVDKGKVAFTFFEDTNQNGVWDYNSGERRIHPNASCNAANTLVVNGVQLWFENNQVSPDCNIENREYSGSTCTWDEDCYRDGVQTGSCHPWGWEGQEYSDKCFTSRKTCSECHWDNQGCVSTGSERGRACAQNGDYCNDWGPADLRHGYVYLRTSEVGMKDIDVVTPSGWIMSPGNYGGSTSFSVNVTTSYGRDRCEAGVKTIGLIPDYNKQCTVQLTQNNIAADESTIATVWGNSGMPGSEPTRLIIGKDDYTEILDDANQPVDIPGTNHINYQGRHYYIFNNAIDAPNGSFETGDITGWFKSPAVNEAWAVDSQTWPPPSGFDGRYYLKLSRLNSGDAYFASNWIDVGRSVGGESFTLDFLAHAHPGSGTPTISSISLQSENYTQAFIGNISLVDNAWRSFSRTVTFPGSVTDTRIRVVLRLPSNNWPVYYDDISVSSSEEVGGCATGSSVACQSSTVISDLPAGDYKLHCDLPTNPQRCSGNPNCNYEGGTVDCIANGWESCSNQDNVDLTVTCAPQCGQTAGCGTGDLGTPNPSNLQPTLYNMTENPGSQNAVPITWSESNTVTDYWTVVTYTGAQRTTAQLNSIATNCSNYTNGLNGVVCRTINYAAFDTNHDGVLDLTPTFTYNPELLRSNDLRLAIRGTNNTCSPYTGSSQNSTWRHSTLDLQANVVGNLYEGDGNPTASICTGPTNPAGFPGSTSRVLEAASGGIPHTTPASSNYTIFDVPYVPSVSWGSGTTVSLDITNNDMSQALACECAPPTSQGDPFYCQYNNILTPTTGVNVNFWLQEYDLVNGPWWQTWGGMIYAATGSVVSDIPQPCIDDGTGYCRSFMAAQDMAETDYSGSVVMSGSGTVSSGDSSGYVTDRFPETEQQVAEGTFHDNVRQENYDFFIREVLISEYSNTVPAAVDDSNDIFSTDYTEDDDDQTRIYYAPGSVTIDPTATIELPAGVDKAVVLINGDLTIRDNNDIEEVVNVDQGDFLGFIVNGNITVEGSVGFDKDMTNIVQVTGDTNLEGVYVADESFIVDGYDALGFPQLIDRKFIGAGTFVGFAGVALDRDFENSVNPLTRSINNLDPVSTFVYRPDFVENLPRFMHNPGLVWQEVN